jgi:hypothetical protein
MQNLPQGGNIGGMELISQRPENAARDLRDIGIAAPASNGKRGRDLDEVPVPLDRGFASLDRPFEQDEGKHVGVLAGGDPALQLAADFSEAMLPVDGLGLERGICHALGRVQRLDRAFPTEEVA